MNTQVTIIILFFTLLFFVQEGHQVQGSIVDPNRCIVNA